MKEIDPDVSKISIVMIIGSAIVSIAHVTLLTWNMVMGVTFSPLTVSPTPMHSSQQVLSAPSPIAPITYKRSATIVYTSQSPTVTYSACQMNRSSAKSADCKIGNEYGNTHEAQPHTIGGTMAGGGLMSNNVIAAPFALAPPRVQAASGDLQPFAAAPRKAPPTGDDDDEGGNTQIEVNTPVGDGLWLLLGMAVLYAFICIYQKKALSLHPQSKI